METFQNLKNVFLGDPESHSIFPAEVISCRLQGKDWILQFRGINTPEDADQIRNHYILLEESERQPLPEGHYYYRDLQNLKAIDFNGKEVGIVKSIEPYPANDVLIIQTLDFKEVLLPWIKQCVGEIDMQNKTVQVDLSFIPN